MPSLLGRNLGRFLVDLSHTQTFKLLTHNLLRLLLKNEGPVFVAPYFGVITRMAFTGPAICS